MRDTIPSMTLSSLRESFHSHRMYAPPPTFLSLIHFWDGGGAEKVVGKPVTTLYKKKNNATDKNQYDMLILKSQLLVA